MAPADETCWTIVRGAAAGDRVRRDEFAAAYLPVIRAYLGARWRSGRYRVFLDDAVQDAFVDCFKEGGALTRVDPTRRARFRTFLFGVVRNVALRYEERARKSRVRQPASGMLGEVAADEASLSRAFDRAFARMLVRRAGARQRRDAEGYGAQALRRAELLDLRFGEGLPIRDIAARWGEEPAAVHRAYRKAREEFRAALHAEVAEHGGGTQAEIERECASLLALLD